MASGACPARGVGGGAFALTVQVTKLHASALMGLWAANQVIEILTLLLGWSRFGWKFPLEGNFDQCASAETMLALFVRARVGRNKCCQMWWPLVGRPPKSPLHAERGSHQVVVPVVLGRPEAVRGPWARMPRQVPNTCHLAAEPAVQGGLTLGVRSLVSL